MSDVWITRRGGGTRLNFELTGGIAPPAAPRENTIWVETSVGFPSWAFSYGPPVNPADGMLWVKTADTGHAPFNALKKNALVLSGAAAFQYVSGVWQSRHAKIFQEGAWRDFRRYLFREGMGQIVQWRGNSAVITDESIVVNTPSSGSPTIATYDMFDFSNYQKLFLELTPNLNLVNAYKFGITFSRNSDLNSYYSATIGAVPTGAIQNKQYPVGTAPVVNGTRATIELVIANAVKESPCYLAFAHSGRNNPEFTVHNVWLE